nr:host cell factor 1-like [Crassostrea gigas]
MYPRVELTELRVFHAICEDYNSNYLLDVFKPRWKYRRCPSFLETSPPHVGKITEYSVFSAVCNAAANVNQKSSGLSCLAPTCTVKAVRQASAHLNYNTKPAIIFRIAANHEKGYGHATQVRRLQCMISKTYKVLVLGAIK